MDLFKQLVKQLDDAGRERKKAMTQKMAKLAVESPEEQQQRDARLAAWRAATTRQQQQQQPHDGAPTAAAAPAPAHPAPAAAFHVQPTSAPRPALSTAVHSVSLSWRLSSFSSMLPMPWEASHHHA